MTTNSQKKNGVYGIKCIEIYTVNEHSLGHRIRVDTVDVSRRLTTSRIKSIFFASSMIFFFFLISSVFVTIYLSYVQLQPRFSLHQDHFPFLQRYYISYLYIKISHDLWNLFAKWRTVRYACRWRSRRDGSWDGKTPTYCLTGSILDTAMEYDIRHGRPAKNSFPEKKYNEINILERARSKADVIESSKEVRKQSIAKSFFVDRGREKYETSRLFRHFIILPDLEEWREKKLINFPRSSGTTYVRKCK